MDNAKISKDEFIAFFMLTDEQQAKVQELFDQSPDGYILESSIGAIMAENIGNLVPIPNGGYL